MIRSIFPRVLRSVTVRHKFYSHMSVTLLYLAYSVSKVCDVAFVRLTGIGCGRLSMATVIRL